MATERYALKVPGAKSASPDITVVAPFDRKPIAKAATADAGAVEQALATAHKLYRNRDAWLPLAKRIDILEKTASLMRGRAELLARIGRGEVRTLLQEVDDAARLLAALRGATAMAGA